MSSEIRTWLTSVDGTGELANLYSEKFESEAITLASVHLLEETDLKDLGIQKMGHRKIILSAIRELRTPKTSSASISSPPSAPISSFSSSSDSGSQDYSEQQQVIASSSTTTTTTSPSSASLSSSTFSGELFISDVKLGEKIGEGGFGQVHRALWYKTTVAAKRTKENSASGELVA